jgi:hypothetical protein
LCYNIRNFKRYKDKFEKKKVIARIATISKIGASTSWIICFPKGKILEFIISMTHTSKVAGHFGVGKIISNLQRYVYWPKMQEDVAQFIKGCIICCAKKHLLIGIKVYTILYMYLLDHGRAYPWLLWNIFLKSSVDMPIYFW